MSGPSDRISAKIQSGPGVKFMKFLLMLFNLIFWASGLLIFSLGVWMRLQLYVHLSLTTYYHTAAPYVLIGIGGFILLIGSFACCCTYKGKAFLLSLYGVVLLGVFLFELSVAISMFILKDKFENGFKKGFADALGEYHSNLMKQNSLNSIQHSIKCCGGEAYTDWFNYMWNGTNTRLNSVPKSCCRVEPEKCTNYNLPKHFTNTTRQINVYTMGCVKKVNNFVQANFGIIGGVAVGFSFLQLFGALLACCLAKNINKSKYERVD